MSEFNKCCVPNPVSNVTATPGPLKIDMTWDLASNPSCPITHITVGWRDKTRGTFTKITVPAKEGADSMEIGNLEPGKYEVGVWAIWACGRCPTIVKEAIVAEP